MVSLSPIIIVRSITDPLLPIVDLPNLRVGLSLALEYFWFPSSNLFHWTYPDLHLSSWPQLTAWVWVFPPPCSTQSSTGNKCQVGWVRYKQAFGLEIKLWWTCVHKIQLRSQHDFIWFHLTFPLISLDYSLSTDTCTVEVLSWAFGSWTLPTKEHTVPAVDSNLLIEQHAVPAKIADEWSGQILSAQATIQLDKLQDPGWTQALQEGKPPSHLQMVT